MNKLDTAILAKQLTTGDRFDDADAFELAGIDALDPLLAAARAVRDAGHGDFVSVSRKVFVPLTKLCRDSCHYCTFAHPPRKGEAAYLSPEEVLEIARAGAAAGCDEVLFTLGDKPELRYRAARHALAALGFESTLAYLAEVSGLVLKETGLLPHINAGVMDVDDIVRLRNVSASQGLMLETLSERLAERGGPHFGSPDKQPRRRIATIEAAGHAKVPFTTGLLVGIGETRHERIASLLKIREIDERFGHIQEVIIQNFKPKAGTRMAGAPEASLGEHLWTIAAARLILGPEANIQAPPNLAIDRLPDLVGAGINDWGGVSPVTIDYVNPEAPWPELRTLEEATSAAGKTLVPRLTVYPDYVLGAHEWLAPSVATAVNRRADAEGFAMPDRWRVGRGTPDGFSPFRVDRPPPQTISSLTRSIDSAMSGRELEEADIVNLFAARGDAAHSVVRCADELRRATVGDTVTYVVNRNINYTNVCKYRCKFCAFSKGSPQKMRGRPYELDLGEIARRTAEAWERGATEVCLQGGIHPDYTGETYLAICHAVKKAAPEIHIHAFSPLEIWQGAGASDCSVRELLQDLRSAGLASVPGTAAEIFDGEIRALIAPGKVTTDQWLDVIRTAHAVGLKSTSTIMFGHVERPRHWADHLLTLRRLQAETGSLTEFVPLPFVHMEAPMYLKGQARSGPSSREALLMHAVARLVLHPLISNIQTSWVKMGPDGAAAALDGGANDLGGTLMNESISRAAGSAHGQEFSPSAMDELIRSRGRTPRQRTTLYAMASPERRRAARCAGDIAPVILPDAGRHTRIRTPNV